MSADEECKINFVLHFEDLNSLESTRLFPNECASYKDAIVIPSIPEEGDDPAVDEIVQSLYRFGGEVKTFAESYAERMKVTATNKRQVINNLKQMILLDEKTPNLYLPYER